MPLFLTRRVIAGIVGGLVLAGGGVAAATVLTSSSGPTTLTVCATAAVGAQTLSNNGAAIDTVPGVTDNECATTTVPTITKTETTTPATTAPPATTEPPTTTSPPTTTEPPATTTAASGTANLWVDGGTGSCTRSATAVPYNRASACGTFDAAYQAASDGDLVLVVDGTYGQQKFTTRGTKDWTSGVTFQAEQPLGATIEAASGTLRRRRVG